MAKETFYFQHDYNARNDEKILELRAAHGPLAYGIFWMLIETMAENENAGINKKFIAGLSVSYGIAIAELSGIISCCINVGLIYEEGDMLFSKRLLRHMGWRKERSETGKKGAKNRWHSNSSAIDEPIAKNGIVQDRIVQDRKEERVFGVSFSEDMKAVTMSDGSIQELNLDQLRRVKEGGYLPHYVKKNKTQ
jgi:hypothetical protein